MHIYQCTCRMQPDGFMSPYIHGSLDLENLIIGIGTGSRYTEREARCVDSEENNCGM